MQSPASSSGAPVYVQVGEVRCPVTGEVINRLVAAPVGEFYVPSFYLSHFTENRIIACGGFASVAECTSKFDNITYAIKKEAIGHDPEPSEVSSDHTASDHPVLGYASLVREARMWADLDHKNVVRYFQTWNESKYYGETGDWEGGKIDKTKPCLYLQLELCERSLQSKLQPSPDCIDNWITPDDCHGTFVDIVLGLCYLHDRGIMHGDLTPANILYRHGVAKITDFGLARFTNEEDVKDSAGTSLYCAPERANTSARPDPKADIFSLGIILFEMLQPFKTGFGRTVALRNLGRDKKFPLGWTDLAARKWIEHMIKEHPSERPSAAYLHDNLEMIKHDISNSQVVSSE